MQKIEGTIIARIKRKWKRSIKKEEPKHEYRSQKAKYEQENSKKQSKPTQEGSTKDPVAIKQKKDKIKKGVQAQNQVI